MKAVATMAPPRGAFRPQPFRPAWTPVPPSAAPAAPVPPPPQEIPGARKTLWIVFVCVASFLAVIQAILFDTSYNSLDSSRPNVVAARSAFVIGLSFGGVALALLVALNALRRYWQPYVAGLAGGLLMAWFAVSMFTFQPNGSLVSFNFPTHAVIGFVVMGSVIPVMAVQVSRQQGPHWRVWLHASTAGLVALVLAHGLAAAYLMTNIEELADQAVEAHSNDAPAWGAMAAAVVLGALALARRRLERDAP